MWCLESTIGTCRMLLALMLDAVGCIYLFFSVPSPYALESFAGSSIS